MSGDSTAASQTLSRPYPSPSGTSGSTVGTLTFTSLPVGVYTIFATAYPNFNATGTAQATGSVVATITANTPTTFALVMGTTVDHISVTAADSKVTLPTTIVTSGKLPLIALAVDASGSMVLTKLTWTATNPNSNAVSTVASVDSNGQVTALAVGTATITAADPESGKSASTVVTVAGPRLHYSAVDIGSPGPTYRLNGTPCINASGQVAATWVGPNFGGILGQGFLYTSGSGFTDIGNIGGVNNVSCAGISDSGTVVGYAYDSSHIENAFLYSGGVMTDLTPSASNHQGGARAINGIDQVAGYVQVSAVGSASAFVSTNGTMKLLGGLAGPSFGSAAYGINASGQVVGSANLSTPSTYSNINHAFLYSGGVMKELGTIPGYSMSVATSINASGQIIGYAYDPNSIYDHRYFYYADGVMQKIESFAGVTNVAIQAYGINDSGQIVGSMSGAAITDDGACIIDKGVLHRLNDITNGVSGITLSVAYGINNAGTIVAVGEDNGHAEHVLILTPVGG